MFILFHLHLTNKDEWVTVHGADTTSITSHDSEQFPPMLPHPYFFTRHATGNWQDCKGPVLFPSCVTDSLEDPEV